MPADGGNFLVRANLKYRFVGARHAREWVAAINFLGNYDGVGSSARINPSSGERERIAFAENPQN